MVNLEHEILRNHFVRYVKLSTALRAIAGNDQFATVGGAVGEWRLMAHFPRSDRPETRVRLRSYSIVTNALQRPSKLTHSCCRGKRSRCDATSIDYPRRTAALASTAPGRFLPHSAKLRVLMEGFLQLISGITLRDAWQLATYHTNPAPVHALEASPRNMERSYPASDCFRRRHGV